MVRAGDSRNFALPVMFQQRLMRLGPKVLLPAIKFYQQTFAVMDATRASISARLALGAAPLGQLSLITAGCWVGTK